MYVKSLNWVLLWMGCVNIAEIDKITRPTTAGD